MTIVTTEPMKEREKSSMQPFIDNKETEQDTEILFVEFGRSKSLKAPNICSMVGLFESRGADIVEEVKRFEV